MKSLDWLKLISVAGLMTIIVCMTIKIGFIRDQNKHELTQRIEALERTISDKNK